MGDWMSAYWNNFLSTGSRAWKEPSCSVKSCFEWVMVKSLLKGVVSWVSDCFMELVKESSSRRLELSFCLRLSSPTPLKCSCICLIDYCIWSSVFVLPKLTTMLSCC